MTLDKTRPHTAGHTYNNNGTCTRCGFDATEWRWWRYNTAEGINSTEKIPQCETKTSQTHPGKRPR